MLEVSCQKPVGWTSLFQLTLNPLAVIVSLKFPRFQATAGRDCNLLNLCLCEVDSLHPPVQCTLNAVEGPEMSVSFD